MKMETYNFVFWVTAWCACSWQHLCS